MDGTTLETQVEEWRPRCLLMPSTKVQKLMRKTRRNKGRYAELYVIELMPPADLPTQFHTREELQINVTTSGRYSTTTSPG
jgi:hypothetical protein